MPDRPDDPMLREVHHVGIACADLEVEVARFGAACGLEPAHRERVEDQGVEEVMFDLGATSVQLLGALGSETPVGRFLARRGPGLHHVAYVVDDIIVALAHLRERGARLVDESPRAGSRGTRIAFVHPSSMGGVLVELVERGPDR